MAYTSKTDAVAKLIEPKTNHNGLMLYSNNVLFDSTTIFYSDSAKTTLATAGNYVFPTNYNSIYVTIGSDGKIVGTASHTNAQNSDTTWIDDRIYQNGSLVSNQGDIGGTNLTISNNIVIDTVWISRPYINGDKAWMVNNAPLNQTTPLSGIDVSDMKGYDLMFYTGEFYNYSWHNWNWIQAFCHVKADTNRQSIFGNKIYFFKPDYWIPKMDFTGGVTYFRRMPNITSINDRYGSKKFWIDMAEPAHDIAENYGVPRTSTKMNKGVTHSEQYSVYGYNFTTSKDKKFYFTGDSWIIGPVSYVYLGYVDITYMQNNWSEYLEHFAVTLIESLVVSDDTWANGSSAWGIRYNVANPYHWKTTWASGTNSGLNSPFNFLSTFYYNSDPANGNQLQFDAEYYPTFSISTLFGTAFKELKQNVKQKILYDINEIANGAVDVNFSSYAGGGIYISIGGGTGTTGFDSVTSANYNTTDLYNHYNDYVVNNSITISSIAKGKFFLTGYESYSMSYISMYQINPYHEHAIYALVHNYDISKKGFTELWGNANHSTRCMVYTWNRQEILGGSIGNAQVRMTFPYQNGARPDQSPALNQSLAVWGMAYADGFFAWNDGMFFDELNTSDHAQQLGRASWDWAYVGYWQVYQNKDIVEANTAWLVPDLEKSAGVWTTTTENYPVSLYAFKRPICRYKLSSDGTKALVICTNPFNNGYTKATFKFRLPAKSNYEFTIDTWGTYTSVVRLISL